MASEQHRSWIAMIFFVLGVLALVYAWMGQQQGSGLQWSLLAVGLLMLVAAVRLRNKVKRG